MITIHCSVIVKVLGCSDFCKILQILKTTFRMVFHDDFCENSGIEQAHDTKCKPSELLIRCGQRLSEFAKTYEVPFQYTAIADKWENITATQLALRPDEVLVVNVAFKASNLLDESVMVANPRQMFLSKIRSMNPKVNANHQKVKFTWILLCYCSLS
jgi:hypothetical protein